MSFLCLIGRHKWDGCKCLQCGKIRDEGHQWDGSICVKCNSIQKYVRDLVLSRAKNDSDLVTPSEIRQAAEAIREFGGFSVSIIPEQGHFETYVETVCVYDDPNCGMNNVDYSQYEEVERCNWIVDEKRKLLILSPTTPTTS